MGLWMLLLLHLHLGNAPRTEGGEAAADLNGVCASLPAPSNVSISSFNMEHTLSFLPGPGTPPGALFAVETRRKKSWTGVAACSQLTAGQTCNLTQAFEDTFDHYQARVQAFTSNRTSSWTTSGWFHPLTDTVLGPPDLSVSGCGNCLLLRLRDPATRGVRLLHDFHGELVLHVKRTRDAAQFRLRLSYKEEIVITYLEPGVEYCVTVSISSFFSSNHVSSKPYCAFTSPPPPASALYVVYGMVGAFCALALLLLGLVVYDGHLSFRLLRPHLL